MPIVVKVCIKDNKMYLNIIEDTTKELLDFLPEKAKDILIARFGLNGDSPKTLEAIGQKLGITRERVRQIEAASFKKLKESKKTKNAEEFFDKLEEILRGQGGFLDIKGFEENIFDGKINLTQENQIKIILNSSQKFYYKKGNSKFGGIWYFKNVEKDIKQIENIYSDIVRYFKKNERLIEMESLVKIISKDNFFTTAKSEFLFEDEYGKNRLKTILRTGKLTDKNLLNQWGLKSWKLINPKGVRERAYLVFQKHKKPLHFRDITRLINEEFELKRPAIPETVCNAIIHFDEFVAVEYGIYALVEWKLFDEKIKEEIIYFLDKKFRETIKGKQVSFIKLNEIEEYIIAKLERDIESFIIQANLFDKELFSRRGDAYMLKSSIE